MQQSVEHLHQTIASYTEERLQWMAKCLMLISGDLVIRTSLELMKQASLKTLEVELNADGGLTLKLIRD